MSKSTNSIEKTAMEYAVAYLANRMHTGYELRKHLADKGCSQTDIEETLQEMVSLRYIDDYSFALRYYEYNSEKHRGHVRAQRELAEKGVDKEIIRNAFEDFVYENKIDEYAMALEIAKQEIFTTSDCIGEEEKLVKRDIDDKLLAKIARKLENRGFSNEDIIRVLDEIRRY